MFVAPHISVFASPQGIQLFCVGCVLKFEKLLPVLILLYTRLLLTTVDKKLKRFFFFCTVERRGNICEESDGFIRRASSKKNFGKKLNFSFLILTGCNVFINSMSGTTVSVYAIEGKINFQNIQLKV